MTNHCFTLDFSKEHTDQILQCHNLAKTTAQLFCINPAGAFFTSAYSESIFAMLTFAGHSIAARGWYYQSAQAESNKTQYNQTDHNIHCRHWLMFEYHWIACSLLWVLASYTR